jgi:hypothetical protein
MDRAATYPTIACDGCKRPAFELLAIDGAQLCGGCVQKSAEIDRKLENVDSHDPVACDGCNAPLDFDARVAVVIRECGGAVLCALCQPTTSTSEAS